MIQKVLWLSNADLFGKNYPSKPNGIRLLQDTYGIATKLYRNVTVVCLYNTWNYFEDCTYSTTKFKHPFKTLHWIGTGQLKEGLNDYLKPQLILYSFITKEEVDIFESLYQKEFEGIEKIYLNYSLTEE